MHAGIFGEGSWKVWWMHHGMKEGHTLLVRLQKQIKNIYRKNIHLLFESVTFSHNINCMSFLLFSFLRMKSRRRVIFFYPFLYSWPTQWSINIIGWLNNSLNLVSWLILHTLEKIAVYSTPTFQSILLTHSALGWWGRKLSICCRILRCDYARCYFSFLDIIQLGMG